MLYTIIMAVPLNCCCPGQASRQQSTATAGEAADQQRGQKEEAHRGKSSTSRQPHVDSCETKSRLNSFPAGDATCAPGRTPRGSATTAWSSNDVLRQPPAGGGRRCCHGADLSDCLALVSLSPPSPPSLSLPGAPTGPGVGPGVWLPWQWLPQQRALPEWGGGHHLPHRLSRHCAQPDHL